MISSKLVATVTVVVPVKDGHNWLPGLFSSLCSQTLKPYKVIVVDDHSSPPLDFLSLPTETPFPIEIVKNFRSGLSSARNTGIQLADSEYIAFLDCDDRWSPNKLEEQITLMQSLSLEVCASSCAVVDIRGEIIKEYIAEEQTLNLVDVLTGKRIVYGSASGVVITSRLQSLVGMFDEQLNFAEDLDYWIRILEITPMCVTQQVGTFLTANPDSMQRSITPTQLAKLDLDARLVLLTKSNFFIGIKLGSFLYSLTLYFYAKTTSLHSAMDYLVRFLKLAHLNPIQFVRGLFFYKTMLRAHNLSVKNLVKKLIAEFMTSKREV